MEISPLKSEASSGEGGGIVTRKIRSLGDIYPDHNDAGSTIAMIDEEGSVDASMQIMANVNQEIPQIRILAVTLPERESFYPSPEEVIAVKMHEENAQGIAVVLEPANEEDVQCAEHSDAHKSSRKKGVKKPPRPDVLKDFKFTKFLGNGSYGKVYLAKHIPSQKICAVKSVKKQNYFVRSVMKEHAVSKTTQHNFLVKYLACFQNDKRYFFAIEYCSGGDLFSHLTKMGRFSQSTTRFFAAEICCALGYLHSKNILYRDLKLENVMINHTGHIKLIDFGLSKSNFNGRKTYSFCGTPHYMAPEIIMLLGHDYGVDWWSLGVLIYECLVGKLPFGNHHVKSVYIYRSVVNEELVIPIGVKQDARSLITALLKKSPVLRLGRGQDGFQDVKAHRFFSKINWNALQELKVEPPIIPKKVNESLLCPPETDLQLSSAESLPGFDLNNFDLNFREDV